MTSFLTLLLLAAMLMTAGCSSPAASGSAYYVSPHGSDEAAGTTPTMPWRTLRRASQATLRPGSTSRGRRTTVIATPMCVTSGESVLHPARGMLCMALYGENP
jgi:hypothetical protein